MFMDPIQLHIGLQYVSLFVGMLRQDLQDIVCRVGNA